MHGPGPGGGGQPGLGRLLPRWADGGCGGQAGGGPVMTRGSDCTADHGSNYGGFDGRPERLSLIHISEPTRR
eukprot:1899547-Heterocapsa_arctica.AAC.1